MVTRPRTGRAAAAVVVSVAVAGLAVWVWRPARASSDPTVPTGAGFSVSVARSSNAAYVGSLVSRLEDSGLPAFTRILSPAGPGHAGAGLQVGPSFQVIVGPYLTIDEAERAQRQLRARGLGARLLVDESVRRVPGHDTAWRVTSDVSLVMIAGGGRLSVVLELPAEPRQVQTRRVSPTRLEADIGPASAGVDAEPRRWQAPRGQDLIDGIAIEETWEGGGKALRARLAVSARALSRARVVGRRVYLDLWSEDALEVNRQDGGRAAFTARQARRDAAPSDDVARDEPASLDYREMAARAIAQLDSARPFVVSAVASPVPDVLAALMRTLDGVDAWLRTTDPPAEWVETHHLLRETAMLAADAVDPAYDGDRGALAREAFARFEDVKARFAADPPAAVRAR